MKAFCPGHITCFFQPVDSYDPMSSGSRGVGIRLSKGSTVTLEERPDQRIEVTIDGNESDAEVTRLVLRMLASDRGFDVTVENELPMCQGFGMSAAGAIAAALCACHSTGKRRSEAFRAAHLAEIYGGGGLGDVAGIMSDLDIPMRTVAGIPPLGKVESGGNRMRISVAVLGEKISTGDILSNAVKKERITNAGSDAMDRYMREPTVSSLFRLSRTFSETAGLETQEVRNALRKMTNAGMCMLGNSVFSTAPSKEMAEILDVEAIECTSTRRKAEITRKV